MNDHDITPARLEVFSNGVIAIMVLDLRVLTDPRPVALLKIWPTFLSYFCELLVRGRGLQRGHDALRRLISRPTMGDRRAFRRPFAF